MMILAGQLKHVVIVAVVLLVVALIGAHLLLPAHLPHHASAPTIASNCPPGILVCP